MVKANQAIEIAGSQKGDPAGTRNINLDSDCGVPKRRPPLGLGISTWIQMRGPKKETPLGLGELETKCFLCFFFPGLFPELKVAQ